ncbi:MAG: hypothetical protein ACXW3L_11135, partial [Limisphaerales bacterium]
WGTLAHTTGKSPLGLNGIWGDDHVNFCKTPATFNTTIWGGTGANPTPQTPGQRKQLAHDRFVFAAVRDRPLRQIARINCCAT